MNKYAELATLLMLATHEFWPEALDPDDCDDESEWHFGHRAFVESPSDELLMAAASHDFQLVGCGNFTAVFSHPEAPGLVFKLNAGTLDRMEEYHLWLVEQDHPHLPRIYHVESFDSGCCAVGERLDPSVAIFDLVYEERQAVYEEQKEVLEVVRPLIEGAGFVCDDTHNGNYLKRDGGWVVNDPFSNREAACGLYD